MEQKRKDVHPTCIQSHNANNVVNTLAITFPSQPVSSPRHINIASGQEFAFLPIFFFSNLGAFRGNDQPILLRRGWTYLTFRKRGTCRGMISSSPLDRECVSEHIVVVLLSYLHGTSLSNGFSSRLVRVLEM